MTMQSRLQDDLKQAMRNRDVLRRSVIRYVRSEIHNQEIAKKTELDDAGVLGVLIRQAQQRRDSIEAYSDANRDDLVEKEQAELEIILEYLPKQLTGEEISELVDKVVQELGAKGLDDKGKVMGRLMPQVRGKAAGGYVNSIVTEVLTGLSG